jgi:hypothetical protein
MRVPRSPLVRKGPGASDHSCLAVLVALFILLNDLGQETISPQELLSCCLFFLLPSCRNLPLPLPLLLPVLLFVILVGICFRRFLFFPSKKTRHSDRSFSQSHR